MSITIRLYLVKQDGQLESYQESPIDGYGTCPNVGDTFRFSWKREQQRFF